MNGFSDLAEKHLINPTPNIESRYFSTNRRLDVKTTHVIFHGNLSDRQIARGIEKALQVCDTKNITIQRERICERRM
jgi:hypothetical protein